MASLSWFFDGTYTRKQLRQLIGALIGNKTAARPLGATSGITSPVTLGATTTTWSVGAFTGVLDVETDATMGPEPFIFDATTTGTITAASASFDRYDLLSLTSVDATTTLPTIVYTAGVVATTLPATPVNSIALCQITVPRTGTGSPTISLIAPYAVASGGIAPTRSSTGYPTGTTEGQYVDDATLNGLVRWTGATWYPVTTDSGWLNLVIASPFISGTSTDSAQYRKRGTVVEMHGLITTTSGNFAASSTLSLVSSGDIPAGYRPAHKINLVACATNVAASYRLIVDIDGSVSLVTGASPGSYVDLACVRYSTD